MFLLYTLNIMILNWISRCQVYSIDNRKGDYFAPIWLVMIVLPRVEPTTTEIFPHCRWKTYILNYQMKIKLEKLSFQENYIYWLHSRCKMNYPRKFRIHSNQSLKQLNKCSISLNNPFPMTIFFDFAHNEKKHVMILIWTIFFSYFKILFWLFEMLVKKKKNCSVVSGENGLNQTKL